MSTVVAPATAAPLPTPHVDLALSPKSYPTLAPSTSTGPLPTSTPSRMSSGSQEGSGDKTTPDEKRTPPSTHGSTAPKIVVKKEPPSSPSIGSQSRPRPRKLDLSSSSLSVRAPGGPMTARDSMHEVGLACLSPGFQTHDPVRQEQLHRSLTVREQQRSIIESRLQKTAKGEGPDGMKPSESNLFGSGPRSSKKRPPRGLSIVPPAASQFANERVVQSAPLHQTFTGRHEPQPLSRHLNHSTTLASTSHLHHVPATQTNNRLPPLSDVFGSDLASRDLDHEANRPGLFPANSSRAHNLPPLSSSPGNVSQQRLREYRSAEEAVHELSGGREELLPRLVHYGNHQQPTTPPSPLANGVEGVHPHPGTAAQSQSLPHPSQGTSRRRTRNEYEQDNGSPPLGSGPDMRYRNGPGPAVPSHGPFGAGRDSPDTQRGKKDEFLALCSRAWDLFHS